MLDKIFLFVFGIEWFGFGVLGLLLFVLLLFKILPSWKWSIPIFVACFGGGIYEAPLGMLLFFLTVALVRKGKHSYSS